MARSSFAVKYFDLSSLLAGFTTTLVLRNVQSSGFMLRKGVKWFSRNDFSGSSNVVDLTGPYF